MTLLSSRLFMSVRSCLLLAVIAVGTVGVSVVPVWAADAPAGSAPVPAGSAPVPAGSASPVPSIDPAPHPAAPPKSDDLSLPTTPMTDKVPSLSDALGQGATAGANDSRKGDDSQVSDGEDSDKMPGMDLPVKEAETPEQAEAAMRGEAFENMMNGVLPMNPDELREAFGRMDVNQKAIEEPLKFPRPEVSFTTISLDPASVPLTFKLATGHVTTVSFLDITGQPWPIKDVTWAGNFEVKSSTQSVDEKFPMYPNLMRIIPLSEYAYGNMSIRLLGLSTPLTFTLRTNKDEVQYRLDLRVPAQGPFALPSIINEGGKNNLKAGNATLTRVMEGVPPKGAQRLKLSGVDSQTSAYVINGTLYLRTPLTLLSPAWTESVRSADGMNVYALSTAPVLLLSDQGQMVRALIEMTQGKDHDGSQ